MPDPNNIIIDKFKTIAFCVPKVANESIKYAFMDCLGLKGNPSFAFRVCSKEVAESQYKDYFKFAFVRNPFDRLVSCWADKLMREEMFGPFIQYGMKHKMSFEDFANIIVQMLDCDSNQHWRSMTYDLMIKGQLVPHFIGRFENIDYDWKYVQLRCPLVGDLPHKNKSGRKHYREYYSDSLRKKVTERFRKDLEVFHYEF